MTTTLDDSLGIGPWPGTAGEGWERVTSWERVLKWVLDPLEVNSRAALATHITKCLVYILVWLAARRQEWREAAGAGNLT